MSTLESKIPAYAGIIYPTFDFTGGLNSRSSLLFLSKDSKFSMRPNQYAIGDNVVRTSSGGLTTRPGRVKLNDTVLAPPAGDTTVRSIYELRTSGGTNQVVINAGNSVYYWTGSAFVSRGTVANANTRFQWAQFKNVLIGVDGSNVDQRYDGTTLAALGGGSPDAAIAVAAYRNRVWMIKGQTLHYCAIGDETDWTTVNNAGSLPIPVTLGQGGTALIPLWDQLIVFANQQVFRLEGTSPSTFELKAINLKYGHQGNSSAVLAAGNEIYYLNPRGAHALSVTLAASELGDVEVNYHSAMIEPTWHDITPANIANVVAVNDTMRNLVIFVCNRNGTNNAEALVADYYHLDDEGKPTWSTYSNWPFYSVAQVTGLNNTPEILMGGMDGFVYRQTDDETDNDVSIPVQLQYVTDLGQPGFIKTFRHMVMLAAAAGGTLVISASYDFGKRVKTSRIDFDESTGDTIGETFTVGESSLSNLTYQQKRKAFPGFGRWAIFNMSYNATRRITIGGFIIYADIRRAVIA